jgi:8-oxo-dGTP diphosphatase
MDDEADLQRLAAEQRARVLIDRQLADAGWAVQDRSAMNLFADTPPMATPRVAAGALIRDIEGRILLVKPTYKDGWDIPGGYVEPGESPGEACGREMAEEIGLHRTPGRLLLVDWAPHPEEGDKLLFIFDGGTLRHAGEAVPDGDEIAEARFFNPAEMHSLMPGRLVRRIMTSVSGADDTYAENGEVRMSQRSAI